MDWRKKEEKKTVRHLKKNNRCRLYYYYGAALLTLVAVVLISRRRRRCGCIRPLSMDSHRHGKARQGTTHLDLIHAEPQPQHIDHKMQLLRDLPIRFPPPPPPPPPPLSKTKKGKKRPTGKKEKENKRKMWVGPADRRFISLNVDMSCVNQMVSTRWSEVVVCIEAISRRHTKDDDDDDDNHSGRVASFLSFFHSFIQVDNSFFLYSSLSQKKEGGGLEEVGGNIFTNGLSQLQVFQGFILWALSNGQSLIQQRRRR